MDQNLYRRIVEAYQETGSVDQTAELCGTYAIKVRKVLITEGLWHSKKSDAVNELRNRGYSVSEIASELGMDEKNVQFYLPYADRHSSSDSKGRVQDFRERGKKNAEGNLFRSDRKPSDKGKKQNRSFEKVPVSSPMGKAGGKRAGKKSWSGYQLHIELVQNVCNQLIDEENIFQDVKDVSALRKLLRTRSGISRDVIVPGGMSLHQLSYAIQELFGFMNSHLHHFSFPKPLFRQLADGDVLKWSELCGICLHVPVEEDFSDLYWDDDYKQGQSAKTWMRSKYTGEKPNYAVGETYIDSLRLLNEEMAWLRKILKEEERSVQDLSLDEYIREYIGMGEANAVLERLTVQDLFRMKSLSPSETDAWREAMRNDTEQSFAYLEACRDSDSFRSLEEAMSALRALRVDRNNLDKAIWLRKDEVREIYGQNPDRVLETLKMEIRGLERRIGDAMHAFDPPVRPVTDTLYYHYDYGDGWLLRITCTEIHSLVEETLSEEGKIQETFQAMEERQGFRNSDIEKRLEACRWGKNYLQEYTFEDSSGREEHNMLFIPLCTAYLEKRPVCVAAEGLSLVEDVGGPHGFFEFLRTIHGENTEEAASQREWARNLGWKEVVPKPWSLL